MKLSRSSEDSLHVWRWLNSPCHTQLHGQDNYLRMAMERYVKALSKDNDCFAAAMGLGMVFARRGKPEIVPWLPDQWVNRGDAQYSSRRCLDPGAWQHGMLHFSIPHFHGINKLASSPYIRLTIFQSKMRWVEQTTNRIRRSFECWW